MESSGSHRSGLLTAGGILSIIVGAFEVLGGGAMVGSAVSPAVQRFVLHLPDAIQIYWPPVLARLIPVGVAILVLGVVAIVGGVSAARRKSFGLSLAGAICALPSVIFGLLVAMVIDPFDLISYVRLGSRIFCALPSVILGILAVIFVALGKREFEAKA